MKPLLEAVYRQDVEKIKKLIVQGDVLDSQDSDGRTPLMHAILAENASIEVVNLLLRLGADPNIRDRDQGWTALHFAAQVVRLDLVVALIDAGAKIDVEDEFGNTPLWRAVFSSQGKGDVIKALLSAGANPDKKNIHGVSPKILASNIANFNVSLFFNMGE